MVNIALAAALIVKTPFTSVLVETFVPLTFTVAPDNNVPLSLAVTVPVIFLA